MVGEPLVGKILWVCLLAGYGLACAEQLDSSSHTISNVNFRPDSDPSPAALTDGAMPALQRTPELWTGLKLEQELPVPALLKTGPAPRLSSAIALIYDKQTQRPLYTKNANARASIASITKLMTAMVVLDAMQPLNEQISIEDADIDRLKRTPSRLAVGMTFTRNEMLSMALMASENRAASALARNYPGGMAAALAAMNAKAIELGMHNTLFLDPAGLNSNNVSTAQDLVKMVTAARSYALIHQYTTAPSDSVEGMGGRALRFNNTNPLVRNVGWNIGISKTGFINEAGRCLVMEVEINQRSVIIVLLNSWGRQTRTGDANRIKRWMESAQTRSHVPRRS